MIPEERLQQLILSKDEHIERGDNFRTEGWVIVDGCLVIYDHEDPPAWLKPVLAARDDYGNTPDAYPARAVA